VRYIHVLPAIGRKESNMIYKYKTATGVVEIDVSEEWYEELRKLDRMEVNNYRKESKKHISFDDEGVWAAYEDESIEQLFESEKSKEERLHEAIDKLKPAQKEIIMMSYFEGKTQEEIASIIGIDQSCVSRRIQTAEKNLKKFFEKTA